MFYVDDLLLVGNLKTLCKALTIVKQLEDLTGIKKILKKLNFIVQLIKPTSAL